MLHRNGEVEMIEGNVVLAKKTVLGFLPSLVDRVHGFLKRGVVFQLILIKDGGESYGKESYLQGWRNAAASERDGSSAFKVAFEWDKEETGVPGAVVVKNFQRAEFYLRTITLANVPGHGGIHFVCNSWVYPAHRYKSDRIFFTNQPYLPSQTPSSLCEYREAELENLRAKGIQERHEWDRFYDYDCYNDLGDPDKGANFVRPILGGLPEYPYPRRIKTCRPPTKTDPKSESRVPLAMSLKMYVPRDERFSPFKMSDAVAYSVKAIGPFLTSELLGVDSSPNEFNKFQDVLDLYEGNHDLANFPLVKKFRETIDLEFFKEVLRTDGEKILKFPTPQVIKEDKTAWRTDEEFAREMLAGLNPLVIRRLQEFPPSSKLDTKLYGHQNSSIKEAHIEKYLSGLTVHEAIGEGRIFIQDYHDTLMPYLSRINSETTTKVYATRTLLFLQDDGTLKPLAIELSLPGPEGDQFGAFSRVFMPSKHGIDGSIWLLAKAYVSVNDSGYHQLISHWLHTHAVIEPFIIATNRQLSVLHPIHKLLHPHFKDTMNVNALSRQILNNAGGLIEKTIFPAKFSMELTSNAYKEWSFPDQALPADLIKRGMAVEDSRYPHRIRLVISDYPYAVDGLEIWSAIKCWVQDYCSLYYKSNEMVQDDTELHLWWDEVRNKGHEDKKYDLWWPKMDTIEAVVDSCTIIIWVASALHAAVNFGQYAYGGFPLKSPSISRAFMPDPGSAEYEEMKADPERVYLRRITNQVQTLIGISLVEILSRHTVDEVLLGQRDTVEWTADGKAMEAFGRFGKKLISHISSRLYPLHVVAIILVHPNPTHAPFAISSVPHCVIPSSHAWLLV